MKRLPLIIAVAGAAFVGHRLLTERRTRRTGVAGFHHRIMKRMMEAMPEDSPPKLIMSILPRLQKQNEQILLRLEEQNDLLRQLTEGRK
jgi:hypothetical protein